MLPLHFQIYGYMQTVKNKFRFIFFAAVVFCNTAGSAQVIGDTTGTLTWSLNLADSVLTISGSGVMPNYNFTDYLAPWDSYKTAIAMVVIGDSVTSIGDFAFYGDSNLRSVIITDSVASIGNYAFNECRKLASVTISDKVASIGNYAFTFCCNLTSVIVPDNVVSIGKYVFQFCSNLVSAQLSNKITRIEDYTFSECINLTSVNIPDKVTRIGYAAFSNCGKLTSVVLPESLDSIICFAFSDCSSLTSITIPANVAYIDSSYVFGFCNSLRAINVDDNNAAYASEDGVLFNKSKTKLIQYPMGKTNTYYVVPNSVTEIGISAFRSCIRLTTVIISNNVIIINQQAFAGCISLKSATIGNSVANISYGSFNSAGLKEIFSLNETPPATAPDNTTFSSVDKTVCVLHVPVGCKNKYSIADSWKEFLIIEDDITDILAYSNPSFPIYPNPTSGTVYLPTECLIKIYTIAGQLLQETVGKEIDLSTYPQGMYFLQTANGWTKIVKE